MKKNRYICLIVALLLAITFLFGCSNTPDDPATYEPVEYYSVYFDAIGGKDVMPVGGFYSPFAQTGSLNGQDLPNYINDRMFGLIKDCGINVLLRSDDLYGRQTDSIIKSLELAEKYKLGYFVNYRMFYDYFYHGLESLDRSEAQEITNTLSEYPAFIGLSLIDEPTVAKFGKVAEILEMYKSFNISGTSAYVNLLPTYSSAKQLSGGDETMEYQEYVDKYLEECKPPFISYDHYVFDSGMSEKAYFKNMSIIREAANKNKIPFWSFLQAGPAFGTKPGVEPFPTEAQVLWNVNTSLAYGVKGFSYYTLLQPMYGADQILTRPYDTDGIFGFDGRCNQWYYYAKKANSQLLASDHILMNSANLGVIPFGEKAEYDTEGSSVIEEKTFRQFKSLSGGEALVGCFDYNGNTVLYLVNYSMKDASEFELSFSGNYNYEVIRRTKSYDLKGRGLKIKTDAGEGVLIRVY